MLNKYLILPVLFVFSVITVWFVEFGSFAIAHSSGGIAVVLLICPGMFPVFLGFFENEFVAWIFAVLLNWGYYVFVWRLILFFMGRKARLEP